MGAPAYLPTSMPAEVLVRVFPLVGVLVLEFQRARNTRALLPQAPRKLWSRQAINDEWTDTSRCARECFLDALAACRSVFLGQGPGPDLARPARPSARTARRVCRTCSAYRAPPSRRGAELREAGALIEAQAESLDGNHFDPLATPRPALWP